MFRKLQAKSSNVCRYPESGLVVGRWSIVFGRWMMGMNGPLGQIIIIRQSCALSLEMRDERRETGDERLLFVLSIILIRYRVLTKSNHD